MSVLSVSDVIISEERKVIKIWRQNQLVGIRKPTLVDKKSARIMKMDESGQYERIDKRGKEIVDSQDVFCKEAEAEAVRDDENEGLQKQRVFEPLTAEDAQD